MPAAPPKVSDTCEEHEIPAIRLNR